MSEPTTGAGPVTGTTTTDGGGATADPDGKGATVTEGKVAVLGTEPPPADPNGKGAT